MTRTFTRRALALLAAAAVLLTAAAVASGSRAPDPVAVTAGARVPPQDDPPARKRPPAPPTATARPPVPQPPVGPRPAPPGIVIIMQPNTVDASRASCTVGLSVGTNAGAGAIVGIGYRGYPILVPPELAPPFGNWTEHAITGDNLTPSQFYVRVPIGIWELIARFPNNDLGVTSNNSFVECRPALDGPTFTKSVYRWR